MIPPKCDHACETRRLRMYILYTAILVICIFLALCHFIIIVLARRKVKEEARDYLARRQSAISYFSTEQLYPNPVYHSVHQDNITITTDGSTAITIEMPDHNFQNNSSQKGSPHSANSHSHNNVSSRSSSGSKQRPLQKIPEEQNESFGSSSNPEPSRVNGGAGITVVAVDVHAEDEQLNNLNNSAVTNYNNTSSNSSSSNNGSNDKKRRGSFVSNHIHSHAKSIFFPRSGRTNCITPVDTLGATNVRDMMTNGPVTVAVATVSALVAQGTYQNQIQHDANNLSSDSTFGIGNISRPNSATSCFDISDIVESPEMPRKKVTISKSKTC